MLYTIFFNKYRYFLNDRRYLVEYVKVHHVNVISYDSMDLDSEVEVVFIVNRLSLNNSDCFYRCLIDHDLNIKFYFYFDYVN